MGEKETIKNGFKTAIGFYLGKITLKLLFTIPVIILFLCLLTYLIQK